MSEIEAKINAIVKSFSQLPYLFIGTGMSMRYASAPSWKELLYQVWAVLNDGGVRQFSKAIQAIEYDLSRIAQVPDEVKKYKVYPILATRLQDQFNDKFYSDDEFVSKVFDDNEFNAIIDNKFNPFKFYISKILSCISLDTSKAEYAELSFLIKNQNKLAGIITTNYDLMLQKLFPDFCVVVGQDNLLTYNTSLACEIYKIHGCINEVNSITLTDTDYRIFDSKLKYLSAKLLTIFVEHPIIFLGYGMGDLNIINLFNEISLCLNAEQMDKTKQNFIFITKSTDGQESVGTRELMFGSSKISMTEIILQDYSKLYKFLSDIPKNVPVKVIRRLQDLVCNFVFSTEAKNDIVVGNINSPDIDDDKVALYIGKTSEVSQIGFDYFTIIDILEDVLFDNRSYLCSEKLITKTFKNIRSNAGKTFLPIYKYTSKLSYPLDKIPGNYYVIKAYTDVYPNASEMKYVDTLLKATSINDIINAFPDHLLKQNANIIYYANALDADDFGNFLREKYHDPIYMKKHLSQYKKLVALYDFKKYYLK